MGVLHQAQRLPALFAQSAQLCPCPHGDTVIRGLDSKQTLHSSFIFETGRKVRSVRVEPKNSGIDAI